jgi:hypothetical protein
MLLLFSFVLSASLLFLYGCDVQSPQLAAPIGKKSFRSEDDTDEDDIPPSPVVHSNTQQNPYIERFTCEQICKETMGCTYRQSQCRPSDNQDYGLCEGFYFTDINKIRVCFHQRDRLKCKRTYPATCDLSTGIIQPYDTFISPQSNRLLKKEDEESDEDS